MNVPGESLFRGCNGLSVSKTEHLFFWSLGGKTWMGTMMFVNAVTVPVLRSQVRDTFLVKMCCVAPDDNN